MDHIKAEKRAYIVLSVAQLALGAYLIARPEQSFSIACYAIGTVLVVYGIIKLIGYFTKDMYQLAFQFDFAMGILSAIVGCLLLFHWEHILRAFPTLDARRFGLSKWWLILIWAIAAGAAGLVLLARPVEATKLIMQLVGINLMIDGGLNLWVVLYTVKEHRNFRFHN